MAVPARHAFGLLSLDATPVLFSTFAAELPQSDSESAEDRAAGTLSLFNLLPADIQDELSAMSTYEKQVATRLIAYSMFATEQDYEIMDDENSGTLSSGAVDSLKLTLTVGSYMAIAACDDDCTDLDVYVLGPSEEEIVKDVELDADPIVSFDITRPGLYTVAVKMEACQTTDCVYSLQIFRKK